MSEPIEAEIIGRLKKERGELEIIVSAATERIRKLTAGIDALEGKPNIHEKRCVPNGRKVPEMIGDAALRFGSDRVFDNDALVNMAISIFPDEDEGKLRRGIYSAVISLLKKGRIVRAPGGFKLA